MMTPVFIKLFNEDYRTFSPYFPQTGALKKSLPCGAGTICVKLFKNYLIAACYDGNIYIFNIKSNDAAVNICGPSNMLLAMDLWNDKVSFRVSPFAIALST